MPKKHLPKFLKTQPNLHTPSSSSQNAPSKPSPPPQSVNDLLAHLRTSQPASTSRPPPTTTPSVPPSLQLLFSLPPPTAPRPRPQVGAPRRPRIPGPPPPASWLTPESLPSAEPGFRIPIHHSLPDLPVLAPRSLAHTALVAIAKNWDFHAVYDQHYLCTLRPGLKALLISYIGRYSPGALTADHLRLLFADGDDEGFTHLDLSACMGPNLTLKDLRGLFTERVAGGGGGEDADWESAETNLPRTRFSDVTHLALGWPGEGAGAWAGLLALARCAPTITHVAIEGWAHPGRPGALRRLARRWLCVRWLDVGGCPAAVYDALREEVEWDKAWRGVETVVCKQAEETPAGMKEERGWAVAELRRAVRDMRGGKGKWCSVVE